MPAVVISGSSTTSSVVSPPMEALQAPLRILKRPSHSGSQSAQGQAMTAAQKSIGDREAEYQAARARIFAGNSQAGAGSHSGATNTNASTATRNPTGPTPTATGESARGFAARQQQSGKQRTAGSSSSNTQTSTTSSSSTSTGTQ